MSAKISRETRKLLRLHAQDTCSPKQEKKLFHKAALSRSVSGALKAPERVNAEFLKAVKGGDDRAVSSLLTKYPALANYEYGPADPRWSVLSAAVENGFGRVVDILLKSGAKTEFRGTGWNARTALHRAAELNFDVASGLGPERKKREAPTDIVAMLLDHGADVEAKGCSFLQIREAITPLTVACGNDNLKTATVLIEKGKANVNAQGSHGVTPLIAVAANSLGGHNRAALTKLLLDNGANVNAVVTGNNNSGPAVYEGDTPLILMAGNRNYYVGDIEAFKLVLDKGADINASANGTTPLMAAARSHQGREVINLLLERGADPNRLDSEGRTALARAQEFAEYASGRRANFDKSVIDANQAIVAALSKVTTVASRAAPKEKGPRAVQTAEYL